MKQKNEQGRRGASVEGPGTARARALPALALAAASGIAFSGVAAREGGDPEPATAAEAQEETGVEDARSLLGKWVETRRVIAVEKSEWELGREVLRDRIELVRREIESLRRRIAETEADIAEVDEDRAELADEKEELEAASKALEETVVGLEERVRGLLARLPAPILEVVRPLAQRVPEDSEDTGLSLSNRYLNVVGILNEVDKFNRKIEVESELRELEDGTTAEVTAVYLGIGQGYYVGADGRVAGVGRATDGGWEWTPANESAAAVARVVAILQDEEPPGFVRVPVRID